MRTQRIDPYTTERPQPLEVLARMAGRTNFVVPDVRRAAMALTPDDVGHALGTSPDKLGHAMAMAVACQFVNQWKNIHELGIPRLERCLKPSFAHAITGERSYRARIVLHDAFWALVEPHRRGWLAHSARTAHLRRSLYIEIRDAAMAMLESAANTAAADAVRYLFGLAVERKPQLPEARDETPVSATVPVSAGKPSADIEMLCDEIIRRPRGAGILTFDRMRDTFDIGTAMA